MTRLLLVCLALTAAAAALPQQAHLPLPQPRPVTVPAPNAQLLVRGQPFGGPVRWFPTRTLAPLDDLLLALGCSWQVDGGVLLIRCGGESGGPRLTRPERISLEGRSVRLEQHVQQDRVFVDVEQVAEKLQCPWRHSREAGTLELREPLLAAGLGGDIVRGNGTEPGFPVTLDRVEVNSALHGFVTFSNRGQVPLRQVLARVALFQPNGKALARFSELCIDLAPGQSATVQFPPLTSSSPVVGQPVARVEFELRPAQALVTP